jgi:putative flippase GtrA
LIGALASVLDLTIGAFFAGVVHLPTRACTGIGLCFGATLNFLAQRRFAFPDRDTRLGQSTLRWVLVTAAQILVHGQLVTVLRDHLQVPYVPAKLLGDVAVFTLLQLLLLRYVVFPPRPAPPPATER